MSKYTLPLPAVLPAELASYDQLTQKLLFSRGLKTQAEAERFLKPDYERDSYDPFLIKGMSEAVDLIYWAVKNGEPIVVYADFDCDGTPGAAILWEFFKKISVQNVSVYIPHRQKEGYGLNSPAILQFVENGVKLMITVDVGITNSVEISLAESLGLKTILSDHHLPLRDETGKQIIPPASVVLNSKQDDDTYPDKMLSGAGVAFKIVQAFLLRFGAEFLVPTGWEKWLLDLVSFAAVADMVPLQNENRTLAYFGLKVARLGRRPGLRSLAFVSKIKSEFLSEEDFSFSLAPRINAASRIDTPIKAFLLLSAEKDEEAKNLAGELEALNQKRKTLVATMLREAKSSLSKRAVGDFVVIGNPTWLPGVLGLLATRLVEEYARPAFVWGRGEADAPLKGSCRSDGVVNVVRLMSAVETGVFSHFGGHEASGGFTISPETIHLLEEALIIAARKLSLEKEILTEGILEEPKKVFQIEAEILLGEIDERNYEIVSQLAPFGAGNPRPIFYIRSAKILDLKKFGKGGEHLEVSLGDDFANVRRGIAFFADEKRLAKEVGELALGREISLVGYLERDLFRRGEIRLRVAEFFPPNFF